MIESQSVTDLIERQIRVAVTDAVQQVLHDEQWLVKLENQITDHVKDRITAKFSNISAMPDLVSTVQASVIRLFDQGAIPGIETYVDQRKVNLAVDSAIQNTVSTALDELVIDPQWQGKIENLVNQNMLRLFDRRLRVADFDALVAQHLDASLDRWRSKLVGDFHTNGITDAASATRITITDDLVDMHCAVSINGDMEASRVRCDDATVQGDLRVNNLLVTGRINTDNRSWGELANHIAGKVLEEAAQRWKQTMLLEILELAKTQGIDFDQVTIAGLPLVQSNTLNPVVSKSNLTKVGILEELTVSGRAQINDTLYVGGRRLGINTREPEMALSIWDEEVSIIGGKIKKDQAYVGTARNQTLCLGVNRKPQLELDTEGLTTINKLRIGQHRIVFERQVPGWSGTRGDVVFNSDPKPGQPFAWQCLGGFQWQAVRTV